MQHTNPRPVDIREQKKALRKQMRQARRRLDPIVKKKYDNWLCHQLWQRIQQTASQKVHCYLPMESEIDIRPLIQQMLATNILVVNPKVISNRKLEHLKLDSLQAVQRGVFGTSHPAGAQVYSGSYDLIIVPGLAFDEENKRLGYGGGYYDQFLLQHPQALQIGLFYPFQKVERVPQEDHDQALDEILYGPLPEKALEL